MTDTAATTVDTIDRAIVNELQNGLPISERPFADAGAVLGIDEGELIRRVRTLHGRGVLSRFGPMFDAERLGGALTLAAMQVPGEDFDRVAGMVNAFPEVAHNYAREHAFNMWFVLATETPEEIEEVITRIERTTGLPVMNLPKLEEFYVGLRFNV